jgi:uncharacterized protein YndB with AHSA1/START domain
MSGKPAERTSLEIKRFIRASRDRVYAAWTDPAQLKEWFGPASVRTREVVAEAHVGGKFCWDLVNDEGEERTVHGEYREVVPGTKVVFTWQWDDDELWKGRTSIVTVDLADAKGGTEVTLVHEQLPSEESRDRHTEGWSSLFDQLEKFFSK